MQVNNQNIQKSALWQPLLNEQLIWNSEYLEYIQTTVNAVTSNLRKITKIVTDNIKKSLKTKNIKKALKKDSRPMYPYPERTQKAISDYLACEKSKELYLAKKAQSHNGMSSLM